MASKEKSLPKVTQFRASLHGTPPPPPPAEKSNEKDKESKKRVVKFDPSVHGPQPPPPTVVQVDDSLTNTETAKQEKDHEQESDYESSTEKDLPEVNRKMRMSITSRMRRTNSDFKKRQNMIAAAIKPGFFFFFHSRPPTIHIDSTVECPSHHFKREKSTTKKYSSLVFSVLSL